MTFWLFVAGTLSVSAGAWMAWPPLGPVTFGAVLMFLAIRMTATKPE